MSGVPDRSRLSLPLKSITARDDNGVPEITSSKPTQQKLMKSLSSPADYFIPSPVVSLFKSLSNSEYNPNDEFHRGRSLNRH